jgi:hypothetical protein
MGFVNEYVSDEDIEKYGLEELYIKYNPSLIESGIPSFHRFMWTINASEEVCLMKVGVGREELCSRFTWVLFWKGKKVKVQTELTDESSRKFSESPYIRVWDLISIENTEIDEADRSEVINFLKDALEVFGYDGARRQIQDTLIKFNF